MSPIFQGRQLDDLGSADGPKSTGTTLLHSATFKYFINLCEEDLTTSNKYTVNNMFLCSFSISSHHLDPKDTT